jgi:hypothetical protein
VPYFTNRHHLPSSMPRGRGNCYDTGIHPC